MVARLNKLQCSWAKQLLGCRLDDSVSGRRAMHLLRWKYRLNSVVWEEVIVTRARTQLRPEDCPVRQLLATAACVPGNTWESMVAGYMRSPNLLVPKITAADGFTPEDLQQAKLDTTVANSLAQRYRREVVRPALQEADRQWFAEKLNENVPHTMVKFADLHDDVEYHPTGLLQLEYHLQNWNDFRAWAVYRSSGCYPDLG